MASSNTNDFRSNVLTKSADFLDGLEWKNNIDTLTGCAGLKFQKNNAGNVELISNDLPVAIRSSDKHDITQASGAIDLKRRVSKNATEGFVSPCDNEYIEISNIRTTPITDMSQLTCPFCGISGPTGTFFGRFCSRKCIAKNATSHRNRPRDENDQRPQSYPDETTPNNAADTPSVVHSNSNGSTNDLKIRIRLSSSPPIENSLSATKSATSTILQTRTGQSRKKLFIWSEYIKEDGSVMAPASTFQLLTGKNPFPGVNQFKLGMALEGIDPVHQTLICPLSVTAVKGYRIRLHFCGYSEGFDFWTNADSPLIFPCGFCEQTGRKLEPPKGYMSDNFNWDKYMKKFKLYAAPDVIFSVICEEKDCFFKPEEKLEAVDKHNPELVCVATVSDVIGENILVHFDGWTHDFDYWCTASSCLIHPIGWCEKQDKQLTPPEGYPHKTFSWKKYIAECGAQPAASNSFTPPTKHSLRIGMKLEVVDPRNPILVRVATIIAISEVRIRIHFDGWIDIYDFWTDLESPDIHPAGWCAKTNFPLQPPVTSEELNAVPGQGGCPVPGCIGVGHIRGSKFAGHHSEFGCPYSQQNLQKPFIHDRLSRPRMSTTTREEASEFKSPIDENGFIEEVKPAKIRRMTRKSLVEERMDYVEEESRSTSPTDSVSKTILSSSDLNTLIDENGKSHYSAMNNSVFVSALSSFPNYDLPLCWDQHSKILPGVKGITVAEVSKWSIQEVVKFVTDLTGRPEYGKIFSSEEIDGEAMLLLTQTDIAKVLHVKLGPAVKIYNAILIVKAAEHLPV